MMNLHPNRGLVAVVFLTLWLLPLAIEWRESDPVLFGGFFTCSSTDCLAEQPLAYSRSVSLILAPLFFLLINAPKPTQVQKAYILTERRALAGLIDLAIIITVIGNPMWVILLGLNQWHFGNPPDIALLAVTTGVFGGLMTLPAWFAYTYWHLARRTQTLGQYVAGYRLVHSKPLHDYREPAIQTIFVFLSIYQSRNHLTFSHMGKFEPPRWQDREGVHTEKLHYD